jgi:nucleotide-binding universal stress UspA family protein
MPPVPVPEGDPVSVFKKILVPTDFSPAAAEAFRAAVSLAGTGGGEVIVAHVTRGPAVVVENGRVTGGAAAPPLNLWDRFRTTVSAEPSVHVTHEVVVAGGVSAAGIVGMLERFGCDLIVIGSHGHGRLRRLLRGSLTDEVVRHAHCPVLVVKAPRTSAPARATPVPAQSGRTA